MAISSLFIYSECFREVQFQSITWSISSPEASVLISLFKLSVRCPPAWSRSGNQRKQTH